MVESLGLFSLSGAPREGDGGGRAECHHYS